MNYKSRIILTILAVVLLTSCSTIVEKFEMGKYGVVLAETTGKTKTNDPNFGIANAVKIETISTETDRIQATLGNRFGFTYTIKGTPNNAYVTIYHVGIHPELTNPITSKTFTNYKYKVKKKIGTIGYIGFAFDHEWELQPGEWIHQVIYEDKVVLEKRFTVYK